MDDDTATQFIKKQNKFLKKQGRDYQDVLNELYQTEIYRKRKNQLNN
ncbi:MAG: hypothetical protein CM15mV127_280 [Caudoviricetes sp.]|nr:MAG: hypothetical protein CM15mV127_280 [Caudoviricetes sp.]